MRRAALALLALVCVGIPAHAHTNEPWKAAVRVRVLHGAEQAVGSGTIVLSESQRTIVLTCAHLFAGPPGKVEVDLFDGKPRRPDWQMEYVETLAGDCLDFDPKLDVGLVSIAPGRVLEETRPSEHMPQKGEMLFTVGCDAGADATVWKTERISDRTWNGSGQIAGYEGIECKGNPAQGRSGGGLFLRSGHIVGVCDLGAGRTGIYAVPRSLRRILEKNDLGWLYTADVRPAPQAPAPRLPAPDPNLVQQPAQTSPPAAPQPAGFDRSNPLHVIGVIALGLMAVGGTAVAGLCVFAGVVLYKRFFGQEDPDAELRAAVRKMRLREQASHMLAEETATVERIKSAAHPTSPPKSAPAAVAATK
jgi:hypothetical protein